MKKVAFLLTLFLAYILLSAHEFWLDPGKFTLVKGECVNIQFMVGENFEGERWSGDKSRVQLLDGYTVSGKADMRNFLHGGKGDSIPACYLTEGTKMMVFNSTNSFIELEAAKFNDYLKEDGLDNATEYRRQHNETDSMGREYYQRSVKTIIQVGSSYDATFKQQTDLPLDIIPLSHPYRIKDGKKITLQLYFKKQPLANTMVNVWHREKDSTIRTILRSDEKGQVHFPVKTTGKWMVSAVRMERLEKDPKARWQSYWGSITWGYR